MRYWCISTSPGNWEICRKNLVWGMDYGYYVTLKKFIRAGDKAVVYAGNGRFVAAIEFVGECFYDERDLGWTKNRKPYLCPYRIKFRIICESKQPPKIKSSIDPDKENKNKARWNENGFNLIDDIVFITDKGRGLRGGARWNIFFQASIINISEEDFNTIKAAIESSRS